MQKLTTVTAHLQEPVLDVLHKLLLAAGEEVHADGSQPLERHHDEAVGGVPPALLLGARAPLFFHLLLRLCSSAATRVDKYDSV